MNKMMFCPMMNKMNLGMSPQMYPQMYPEMYEDMEEEIYPELEDIYAEDDRDDEYLNGMYSESCKKISPYIDRELDRMETEESPLYEDCPVREMVEHMGDKIYDKVVADMPDMEEQWEERQYGRRRFLRDLVGVLLLGSIGRRRRRRRRRRYDYNNDYWYNY